MTHDIQSLEVCDSSFFQGRDLTPKKINKNCEISNHNTCRMVKLKDMSIYRVGTQMS